MRSDAEGHTVRRRLLRSAALIFCLSIGANAIGYLYQILVARGLSKEDFATLAALVALLTISERAVFGLQIQTTRLASRQEDAAALLAPAAGLGVLVGLLTAAVGLVGNGTSWTNALILGVSAALWFPAAIGLGVLQARERFVAAGSLAILAGGTRVAVAVALVDVGWGVTGALGGSVARAILVLAGSFALAGWGMHEWRARTLPRGTARDSLVIVLGLASFAALTSVDLLAAKRNLPSEVAGTYAAAAVLAKLVLLVSASVGIGSLPLLAREVEPKVQRAVLARLVVWSGVGSALAALAVTIAARPLVAATLGERYVDAAGLVPLVAAAAAGLGVAQILLRYFLAIGDATGTWIVAGGAVVEIGLMASARSVGAIVAILALVGFAISMALGWVAFSRASPSTRAPT